MTCLHDTVPRDLLVVFPPVPANLQPIFKGEFPSELWPLILGHLRRPTPAPLSKPDKAAIRQPHLALCMREWKYIVEPLLYTHITTDHFSGLLHSSTIARNNRRRFDLTRSLRIEYMPKHPEPTYKNILNGCTCQTDAPSVWLLVALEPSHWNALALQKCDSEVDLYDRAFNQHLEWGMRRTFPKLETIAVDSIWSQAGGIWADYESSFAGPEDSFPIQRCNTLFTKWLSSGNLKHLCTRDTSGPLCIEHLTFAHCEDPRPAPVHYTRTLHFNKYADQLALPCGGKIRWISDAPPSADWAELLLALGRCSRHLYKSREGLIGAYSSMGTDLTKDIADVDIYCSTGQYGPAMFDRALAEHGLSPLNVSGGRMKAGSIKRIGLKEESAMVTALEGKIQALYRQYSGLKDVFRWHMSSETPVCEACGSGVPR